jgi:hypothetical protein
MNSDLPRPINRRRMASCTSSAYSGSSLVQGSQQERSPRMSLDPRKQPHVDAMTQGDARSMWPIETHCTAAPRLTPVTPTKTHSSKPSGANEASPGLSNTTCPFHWRSLPRWRRTGGQLQYWLPRTRTRTALEITAERANVLRSQQPGLLLAASIEGLGSGTAKLDARKTPTLAWECPVSPTEDGKYPSHFPSILRFPPSPASPSPPGHAQTDRRRRAVTMTKRSWTDANDGAQTATVRTGFHDPFSLCLQWDCSPISAGELLTAPNSL